MTFELHAHRGIPKIYPENTLEGFAYAIKLGAKVLEVDVVVNRDHELIVSHDPFMRSDLCKSPSGLLIRNEREHNLYELTTQEIKQYDVGSLPSNQFPDQMNRKLSKPSFQDLAELMSRHPNVRLNIEVKSEEKYYGLFQPMPKVYAQILISEIKQLKCQFMIQSFDTCFLNELYILTPDVTLGLLVNSVTDPSLDLALLDFLPNYYNPNFNFLTCDMMQYLRSNGIKVVPWTVNDLTKAKDLVEMGVDGLITDKIDEFLKFFG